MVLCLKIVWHLKKNLLLLFHNWNRYTSGTFNVYLKIFLMLYCVYFYIYKSFFYKITLMMSINMTRNLIDAIKTHVTKKIVFIIIDKKKKKDSNKFHVAISKQLEKSYYFLVNMSEKFNTIRVYWWTVKVSTIIENKKRNKIWWITFPFFLWFSLFTRENINILVHGRKINVSQPLCF